MTNSPARTRSPKPRPRWGPIDTWPAFLLLALALYSILVPAETTTKLAASALFIGGFVQQLFQAGWPMIVSSWKGLGVASDWGFRFKWIDIAYGFGLAVVCAIGVIVVTAVTTWIVGLSPDEDPSNTDIISDNQDSPWIIGIILVVVIGAPLTEELLYRGLVMRAFEKYLGIYVAVVISTVIFTIPHFQLGSTAGEATVLFAGIGTIGLILALAAVRFGRLGPGIIGHFFFNSYGVITALLT